jgi:trimethylamine--corrinoid protein Co-methyltransferase
VLANYEAPPIDDAIDAALLEFIDRRKASMPDMWY